MATAFFLRKIARAKWFLEDHSWLRPDELPSDVLSDLKTTSNTLSVWKTDGSSKHIDLLVTALACNCDRLSHLDYMLLPINLVHGAGVRSNDENGTTPVTKANEFHADLMELTIDNLWSLAVIGSHYRVLHKRVPRPHVSKLVKSAIESKLVSSDALQPKMKQGLGLAD